jgi:hypothetical protein
LTRSRGGFPGSRWHGRICIELEGEREAFSLSTKKWPAPDAAARVREAARRAAEAERRARIAEYIRATYESLFPWLPELIDEGLEENVVAPEYVGDSLQDPAKHWLTDAEYNRLPSTKKYQLALDRYWQRKKTRWEIGRDYERYIGYQYEGGGLSVRYHGIIEGFEDLGRDLIVSGSGITKIVQCKYWSSSKLIHEKHIFQLFGTLTAYGIDHPSESPSGVFYTSTVLSDRARLFAEQLEIDVHEKAPLDRYPCIKCNLSKRTGELIYHLPFDQQYDRTIIEDESLERYVATVEEAERLGFRRAKRWRGE